MGFLARLFGDSDTKPQARRLHHPRDLQAGDIIKFRFMDQSDIGGKEFEVEQINTYLYGNMGYPELVLKDRSGAIIYMMLEDEDGEEYIALSRKISRAKLADVLSPEQLKDMEHGIFGVTFSFDDMPHIYTEWMTAKYRKTEGNVKGGFLKGDARTMSMDAIERHERFTSHICEDQEGDYALELECYESGEKELSVTVYHEFSTIEEMWPGK